MVTPKNYKQVLSQFRSLPKPVQDTFAGMEGLLESSWNSDVAVAYALQTIEVARRYSLYTALVRRFDLNVGATWEVIDSAHLDDADFWKFLDRAVGRPFPNSLKTHLEAAKSVRNKMMHGQTWTSADARNCLASAFSFMEKFSAQVRKKAGFDPCGKQSGYLAKGRGSARLDEVRSKLILRGLGLPVDLEFVDAVPKPTASISS